jgi:polyadenylate-binding protein 2
MEFADEAAVQNATLLNESLLLVRQWNVVVLLSYVPGHGKDKGGKKGKGKKGKGKAPYGGYAGYAPMWGKG